LKKIDKEQDFDGFRQKNFRFRQGNHYFRKERQETQADLLEKFTIFFRHYKKKQTVSHRIEEIGNNQNRSDVLTNGVKNGIIPST